MSPEEKVQARVPITKPSNRVHSDQGDNGILSTSSCASMSLESRPNLLGSLDTALTAIDETKPCGQKLGVDVDAVNEEMKEEDLGEAQSSGPVGPCKKKCMKERLRGLADRYVSCLQAIDVAGDMRGYAGAGPTAVHGPQPFESSSPSSD